MEVARAGIPDGDVVWEGNSWMSHGDEVVVDW